MAERIYILNAERDDKDGLIVTFSDGTTAGYVAEELLELRPFREPVDDLSIRAIETGAFVRLGFNSLNVEGFTVTDATGHMNRPGTGPFSSSLSINGIPMNCYINYNPETNRVEIAKPSPPGVLDELVMDFPDRASAQVWVRQEFEAGRLPLAV